MALPDFLLIGAMKCGTTTLAAQLAAQPGLFMTDPKEPNFFSDDAIHARGPGWYESLFAAAAPGDLKGEASTHYTKLPTHPQTIARMTRMLAAPKLIYMIRNPLDRVISHFIHETSHRVIRTDLDRAIGMHPELVEYGRYGMQIAPFLQAYGAGAVLLTSLEQLKADPQAELDRIGRFIGAPGPLHWDDAIGARNSAEDRFRHLPAHQLLVNSPWATALRRTLVPKSLREWVKRKRSFTERPQLSPETRRRLEDIFAADHTELARAFPGHPALSACYPFRA